MVDTRQSTRYDESMHARNADEGQTHDLIDHYIEYLQRDNTEAYVVSRDTGRAATNALKGSHSETYEMPVTNEYRRRKSTLDRGLRRSNRSVKQAKQWRTSQQERSVLRYTTG